jgi:predicted Zn-dependent protease with MMP-like domain
VVPVGDRTSIGDAQPFLQSGTKTLVEVSDDDFEELVGRALDTIPARLAQAMQNVVVLVEPEPPDSDPDLLGIYEGVPLTERDQGYAGVLPDRITIFQGPISRICHTYDEVVEEVRVTVVHEVAHHFGIDDDELHDLGYG